MTLSGSQLWGTDTPISMPEPLTTVQQIYVDMGGFGFTAGGIAHNFREADLEVYATPTFLPIPSVEGDR
jgi:hypothetical protein